MRMVKTVNTYCPKCKTHTEHTVALYKKGRDSPLSEGARRYARKKAGYGSQPKPIQKKFAKTTKKQLLKYKCKECGYVIQRKGMRLKKLEFA
ncbi:MAG: 50S ribosomal protein L44e [Candidatus Odinarchaeota archaeon]